MQPTWVGVVTAVSLAIIALAALAVATAVASTALGMRAALRALRDLAGPALDDARQLVATIRTEVEALAATSSDLRERIVRAADAVEARLALVNALLGGVQGSVQSTALGIAATIRGLLRGLKMRRLKRGRKKR
jgi:uncharacterized protein YlxW (UPF0749 family)